MTFKQRRELVKSIKEDVVSRGYAGFGGLVSIFIIIGLFIATIIKYVNEGFSVGMLVLLFLGLFMAYSRIILWIVYDKKDLNIYRRFFPEKYYYETTFILIAVGCILMVLGI